MSRIRTIKPTFWTSEQVVECSPITRLLFVGLWNFCDAAGRHSFSPKQIKGQVLPSDDFTVEQITDMLLELSSNGLLIIYRNENKEFLEVTGWKHQKIDHEQPSKIPGPFDENSEIIRGVFGDDSSMDLGLRNKDLGLREFSRARARPTKPQKSKIPENEEPTAQQSLDADSHGLKTHEAVNAEWARFRDYNLAKGTELVDWDAAWRRWLGKREEFNPPAKPNGSQKAQPPPKMPGQNRLRTKTGLWVDNKFYPD